LDLLLAILPSHVVGTHILGLVLAVLACTVVTLHALVEEGAYNLRVDVLPVRLVLDLVVDDAAVLEVLVPLVAEGAPLLQSARTMICMFAPQQDAPLVDAAQQASPSTSAT
jgi:hypothetical protein